MKLMEWITIFEGLEKQGANEDTEVKFYSEAGVPYEIKRLGTGIPDIQKDEKNNLFKIRIT